MMDESLLGYRFASSNTQEQQAVPSQKTLDRFEEEREFKHPDDFGYTDPRTNVRPRGSDLQPQTPQGVREFGTGATRDLDANKLDFEGFLSPLVLERYAEHMHKARRMPDGSMRESDNWQLGIPVGVYIKSLWRHFFAVWKLWRGLPVTEVVKGETIVKDLETELCALLFNASGMLHETLKAKRAGNK